MATETTRVRSIGAIDHGTITTTGHRRLAGIGHFIFGRVRERLEVATPKGNLQIGAMPVNIKTGATAVSKNAEHPPIKRDTVAYMDGREAYASDLSFNDNPYISHSEGLLQWYVGWLDGRLAVTCPTIYGGA